MRVRFFAAAAEAAGATEVEMPGPVLLGELRTALSHRYGPEFAGVLDRCSVMVDGARPGDTDRIAEDSVVDVLPPFAGG